MPSARAFVQEGQTGYFTAFASTESLVDAIRRASLNPNILLGMKDNMPTIKSSVAYATVIRDIYNSSLKKLTPAEFRASITARDTARVISTFPQRDDYNENMDSSHPA